jgi:hypothetical protein
MANDELMTDFQKLKGNTRTISNGEARIIDFDTKEPSKASIMHLSMLGRRGGRGGGDAGQGVPYKRVHIKGQAFVFQFSLRLPTTLEIKRLYL